MNITTERFKETARQELANAHTQKFLQILPLRLAARRDSAYQSFPDPEAAHRYGQTIRDEAIQRLPELLQIFETNAIANGARVFWAEDSRAANGYIAELAKREGVSYVTKGKSMVTEELGLNEALAQAGIETWETDLGEFITQLLQRPPFHISLDSGPKRSDEIDGPEELHIVILDNGRSAAYQDPKTREALRCIRCGACLNACPVYGKVGGYPYGWAYSGPMGQVLTPALQGLGNTGDLIRACTLCHRCKIICPAGIDHPSLLLYYRYKDVVGDRALGGNGAGWRERFVHTLLSVAGSDHRLWRLFAKVARLAANRFRSGDRIHSMPNGPQGWFSSRDLPALPAKTLRERWAQIDQKRN